MFYRVPGGHQPAVPMRMLAPCMRSRATWYGSAAWFAHGGPCECREMQMLEEWTWRCCCDATLRSPCAPPVRRDQYATLQVYDAAVHQCWPWSCCACRYWRLGASAHHLRWAWSSRVSACRHATEWTRRCCCGASLRLPSARRLCDATCTPLCRCACHPSARCGASS